MKIKQTQSLVDYLASKIGCIYVSDLHYLNKRGKAKVIDELKRLNVEDFSREDWNEALEYLAKGECADTAENARKDLLTMLTVS